MASAQALEPTLLHAVRRHWLLAIVTFVVIAAAAAGLLALQSGSAQTAEMSMLLEDPRESTLFGSTQSPSRGTTDYLADQVDILNTAEIARRSVVAARQRDPNFPYNTVEFLSRRTIARPNDQALVTVRFTAPTTETAVLGANSVAEAYQAFLETESSAAYTDYIEALDTEIDELQDRITDLQRRINAAETDGELTVLNQQVAEVIRRSGAAAERRDRLRVDARLLGRGVRLVTPAVVSQGSAMGSMRSLLAVVFVATFGAIGVAYLYALRRRTFGSAIESGLALEAPLVGIVPEYDRDELANLDADRNHRFVVDIIGEWEDRNGAGEPIVIAVTAAKEGAGVTTSVAAMASVLGWRRQDTVVVDADFDQRQLTRLLQPDVKLDHAGLTDVVDGKCSVTDVGVDAEAEYPSVSVLPRGSRQPTSADSGRMPAALREVAAAHPVTLIDVPAGTSDTLRNTILSSVDYLLVLVPHGSRVVDVERLRDGLDELGIGCDGVIFNRVPRGRRGRRTRRTGVTDDATAAARNGDGHTAEDAEVLEGTDT